MQHGTLNPNLNLKGLQDASVLRGSTKTLRPKGLLSLEPSMPPTLAHGPMMGKDTWEFPKIGDPNIVP